MKTKEIFEGRSLAVLLQTLNVQRIKYTLSTQPKNASHNKQFRTWQESTVK